MEDSTSALQAANWTSTSPHLSKEEETPYQQRKLLPPWGPLDLVTTTSRPRCRPADGQQSLQFRVFNRYPGWAMGWCSCEECCSKNQLSQMCHLNEIDGGICDQKCWPKVICRETTCLSTKHTLNLC